ncbi:hypothetical protein [Methylobacterium nodulans]|uniref:Uncharacterized protein n=1 Tax=Methylobacterium nodulans (strain LMG 21967 / CNCM I-2342 / ORS 2060) TaxID=460265 RepID=B8IT87_METNO|nr:hypothetical protein [Methylobacterium nodulans]ACL56973.1 hypothetical protein Mnod_1985 [Methylobacterium nodulans ORS 2060]
MSYDLPALAAQATAGLNIEPAVASELLRRVAAMCTVKQRGAEEGLLRAPDDERWVRGYSGGCGDCGDLIHSLADIVAGEQRR